MEDQGNKNISNLYSKTEALLVDLAKLTITVKEGFKGVHARQDVTNGRIGKVEEDTREIDDTVKDNAQRVRDIENKNQRQEEKKKEDKSSHRWLKREFISTAISVVTIILTAAILLILGLK